MVQLTLDTLSIHHIHTEESEMKTTTQVKPAPMKAAPPAKTTAPAVEPVREKKAEKEAAAALKKAEKDAAAAIKKAAAEKAAAEKAAADAQKKAEKEAAAALKKAAADARAAAALKQAERAAAVAAKKAAAEKAKAERAVEQAKRRADREAAGESGAMASLMERARSGAYVKSATGQLRSTDDLAEALDAVPAENVIKMGMELFAEANKYSGLTQGQQSMNYRNRMRGAIRKGTFGLEAVIALRDKKGYAIAAK